MPPRRVDKTASGEGPTGLLPGALTTLTILPTSTFDLQRIIASGDSNALLLTGMAGEQPMWVDPIGAVTLAPGAYHGPTFEGVRIQAGVPCTVTYRVFNPALPLRLTLIGKGDGC